MSGVAEPFPFKLGDLVLVKWLDSMVYFAKIKKIDAHRRKCVVVFDDKSHDEADFDQIHSVDETTTDIICIKCKRDDSDSPNEIVLCDTCGIGYHQKCHAPPIPATALELNTPWNCTYCLKGVKCPFLTESLDVLQNLLSEDEAASHDDVESGTTMDTDEGDDNFLQSDHALSPPAKPAVVSPMKKKGKRSKLRRGLRPVLKQAAASSRSLSTSAWKMKLISIGRSSPSSAIPANSVKFTPSPPPVSGEVGENQKRKRPQLVALKKKARKSSVQSQTLSVTRLPVSIHDGDTESDSSEPATTRDADVLKGSDSAVKPGSLKPALKSPTKSSDSSASITDDSTCVKSDREKRPICLRVSLNLSDNVEPTSPISIVLSPKVSVSTLPPWEDQPSLSVVQPVSRVITPSGRSFSNSTLPKRRKEASQSNSDEHGVERILIDGSPSPSRLSLTEKEKQSSISSYASKKNSSTPLTPFTASALPFSVIASDVHGRKRKYSEKMNGSALPPPSKRTSASHISPSPPLSPSDDVFESSTLKSDPTHAQNISRPPSEQIQSHTNSPTTEAPLTNQNKVISNCTALSSQTSFLVPESATTAIAPVGYGATSATASLISQSRSEAVVPRFIVQSTVSGKETLSEITSSVVTQSLPATLISSIKASASETLPSPVQSVPRGAVKTVPVLQHAAMPSMPTTTAVEKHVPFTHPKSTKKLTSPTCDTAEERRGHLKPKRSERLSFSTTYDKEKLQHTNLAENLLPEQLHKRQVVVVSECSHSTIVSSKLVNTTSKQLPMTPSLNPHPVVTASTTIPSSPKGFPVQKTNINPSPEAQMSFVKSTTVLQSHSPPAHKGATSNSTQPLHILTTQTDALPVLHIQESVPSVINPSLAGQSMLNSSSSSTPVTVVSFNRPQVNPAPRNVDMSLSTSSSHTLSKDQDNSMSNCSSDQDVFITSVEEKGQSLKNCPKKSTSSLLSYPKTLPEKGTTHDIATAANKVTASNTSAVFSTSHIASKSRPHDLYAVDPRNGRKVALAAYQADVPASPVLPKNTTVVRLSTQHGAQSREQVVLSSAVHPTPSTHSSSGSLVPLVVTPTAYTQQSPAQEGTAYFIPVRGGAGKGVQQVTYSLPAAVMPQASQQGGVQYILETVATTPVTSASVVCNPKNAIPVSESLAVRNKSLQHGSGFYIQSSMPAEAGKNNKPPSGHAAKPYTIISSQPATPVEIRGIPVNQRVIPIANPQLTTQYSVVPGTQYIHSIKPSLESNEHPHTGTTAIPATKCYQPGTGCMYISKAQVPAAAVAKLDSSQQSNTYACHSAMERTPSTGSSVDPDFREIGKKIENAFTSCNEDMLIAAFEDTWRKFQANGKKYDALNVASYHPKSYATKSPIPPNAEVIRVPGTSSRLSLVRPTNARPKIALKPAPEPAHVSSAQPAHPVASQQPQQQTPQQVQYVYSYATKANQAQVYLKPIDNSTHYSTPSNAQYPQAQQTQTQSQAPMQEKQQVHTAQKTYQVTTSGVFYPTHTSEANLSNNSQVVLRPVSVPGSQQAIPKPAPSNPKLISERPPEPTERFSTLQNRSVVRMIHSGPLPKATFPRNPREPSLSSKPNRLCVICRKEATYLCSGCQKTWYCGKDCQLKAWDKHSEHCQS